MSGGPEVTYVEQPFIDQLVSMGWQHTTGNLDFPTATSRESFRDVLLLSDLRTALHRINLDPQGKPWLDNGRIGQAVSVLTKLGPSKLLEANQLATALLLKGTVVDGVEGWEKGRTRTVHFIDWDNPANNEFRVINQFRVDEPAGQAKKFMTPDLVLFCNGIPLVVVECKAPTVSEPMEDAIDQLQRYANQRSWSHGNEGNERLFHTNQFVVATHFDEARVGTFSSQAVHFLEWKDTSPTPMADVAAAMGRTKLSSQEKLIAGMLRPEHLLDIVRHFTLFKTDNGKTYKVVSRYQQFRAVQLAVLRLVTGKTRTEDGESDRRGGIIWHTQGSGKSLTMVFLIRKMRSHATLRKFKIVVVTDRKDLQKQLSETATLTDETLTIVKPQVKAYKSMSSADMLKEVLAKPGKDLVFAMIQKYRGDKVVGDEDDDAGQDDTANLKAPTKSEVFPVLNEDESILVLVDEAHRSHTNMAHANLREALPNCARIGFTGTPIIMGEKQKTYEIFGSLIDRYSIKQSEEDGSTLPILYEGRTTESAVKGGRRLDEVFEDMLADRTPEELEAIKQKYATKGDVMEAEALIAAKARDMLLHYAANVLPNGFKAQVVAVSRRAAIRYGDAFRAAQAELVAELEALTPETLALPDDGTRPNGNRPALLVAAHPHLAKLKTLEFAPIISSGNNDDGAWKAWSDPATVENRIARFKKPLTHDDPNKADPLAFLIVKSMLLTGFDAPIEQVMYLDRHVQQAELLQAIARVNRTNGKTKSAGLVVDYYGVAKHLKEALKAYSDQDVDGALKSLNDEIPRLRDRHFVVVNLFRTRGVDDIWDTDECVELLRDEKLRAEFQVKLKAFLSTLDLVLPRPEALPYVNDAEQLAHIQLRARNLYRDSGRPIGKEVGAKVRQLIDDHVISLGIDPKIPPISLMDANFDDAVDKIRTPRAKASEMEHALRYHIRQHQNEDPEHYQKLSERLNGILADFKDRWDDLLDALKAILKDVQAGRQTDETGLDPETQAPFYDVLKREVAGDASLTEAQQTELCEVTVELVQHLQTELKLVEFWSNAYKQTTLRAWVVRLLDGHGKSVPFDRLEAVADRLVELAKANHYKLVR